MSNSIFIQLALVLSLSSLFGYLVHRLKLPIVVAYLLAGVSLSGVSILGNPHHAIDPKNLGVFTMLPNLGIALVLFLIGMELDLRELKTLGKPIIAASLTQITISLLAGYAIASYLGFSQITSIYMGLGLSFSSTIVVIKMLLEKRDLASLYGKLSLGILVIEDLVAILALMVLSVDSSIFRLGLQHNFPLIALVIKALILFGLTFVLSKYVLEKIFDNVAKSQELLFLTAITWCFIFTTLAIFAGFSVVIGAFLAGVALASSPYRLQIAGKIKPLRDFFVALFFVYLGMQVNFLDLFSAWPVVIVLTLYATLVKPTIFLLVLGIFGFRKHTLFRTALNLTQISEFSLVILLIGVGVGVVTQVSLSIMPALAFFSFICSTAMITYSKNIYNFVLPVLPFFEHSGQTHFLESKIEEQFADHIVIIGAHRVGGPVVKYLKKEQIPFLVMDFNPHIVEQLRDDGVKVVYGDISDPEILDNLQLEKAKLIISTATEMGDNELLLEEVKRRRLKAKVIARAQD